MPFSVRRTLQVTAILAALVPALAWAGSMTLLGVGGGSGTTHILLVNTGSALLVNTGSKFLIQ